MTLVALLNMQGCLKLPTKRPRPENKKRLISVQSYFANPLCVQHLKVTSLCLQLTQIATSISGKTQVDNGLPLIAELSQGAIQVRACHHLSFLLANLWRDPGLDHASALSALVMTTCHMVIRFRQYSNYPWKLWELSRVHNSGGYAAAILDFLHAAPEDLDTGFSLPLQRDALRERSIPEAALWLLGDAAQSALDDFAQAIQTSSLEVERRHAQAKRNEGRRLKHVAVASRDHLLRRHATWRQEQLRRRNQALRVERKARHSSSASIAWERMPALVPQPASSQLSRGRSGSSRDMAVWREEHKAKLQAEAAVRREHAKRAVADAQPSMPLSVSQWATWLESNMERWREMMRTSPQGRRGLSTRVSASPALQRGVDRLQPVKRRQVPASQWAGLLANREGWHLLRSSKGHLTFLFLVLFDRQTYVSVFDGGERTEGALTLKMDATIVESISANLRPLAELDEELMDAASEVFEVKYSATFISTTCALRVEQIRKLVTAAAQRRHKLKGEDAGDCSDDADDVAELCDSEVHASETSVDTDMDSEDEASDAQDGADAMGAPVLPLAGTPPAALATTEQAARAAPGTFVKWENTYFTLTDQPEFPYVRIRMKPSFALPGRLGGTELSKSLMPQQVGDSRDSPIRTYIVLKAWALWRTSQGTWLSERRARQRQYEHDCAGLMQEIRNLGYGAAMLGHPHANDLLLTWLPGALMLAHE